MKNLPSRNTKHLPNVSIWLFVWEPFLNTLWTFYFGYNIGYWVIYNIRKRVYLSCFINYKYNGNLMMINQACISIVTGLSRDCSDCSYDVRGMLSKPPDASENVLLMLGECSHNHPGLVQSSWELHMLCRLYESLSISKSALSVRITWFEQQDESDSVVSMLKITK